MFRNNLKLAIRNMLKQRMYTLLNVLGLGVGMASCLIISFYVSEETSYETFYQEYDQVYRLTTYWKQEEGEEHYATTPPPLGPMLLDQAPEIEAMVRMNTGSDLTMRADHNFERPFRETNAWSVDRSFFQVFDYGFIRGDYESLFTKPRTIVMPKSTAIRYFGQEAYDQGNIVGRHLGGGGDGGTQWEIVGVMEDQPRNSHFQFDMLLSREDPEALNIPNWGWNNFHTYVKLRDNSPERIKSVETTLEQIVATHAVSNSGVTLEFLREKGLEWKYTLQPIADIHLTSSLLHEMRPKGNRMYVNSLIAVAIFIIVLACVNFVNLSTAKSSIRAKEIGVKKVLGSGRNSLIYQFLLESLLFSFLALLLAFGLAEGMVIILENTFQWQLNTAILDSPINWLVILGVTTSIGLMAGIYPALYLTSFRPIAVLKGNLTHASSKGPLRNLLVGFQFVVSIALIISALVIKQQVEYTRSKDLGFDKENVLVIQNDREIDDRREEFKTFLTKESGIQGVSFATGLPGQLRYARRDFTVDGNDFSMGINWYQADDSYLQTMDLKLAEGRAFDKTVATESNSLWLNEQAAKELGLTDPVGTFLTINKGQNDEKRVQVIGILKDFNLESFDKQIQPLAIEYLNDFRFKDYIAIRVQSNDLSGAIEKVEAAWKEFEPNVPLVYSFLDKDFDRLFKSEQQLSKIFSAFTILAIFIASLGLFGLASYVNEQRTKEIGIRKVLGASFGSILLLLYKDYFRLILISFTIAGALSFYFMKDWLQSFVYRINMEATPFIMALLGSIILAVVTIGYQSVKAAYRNPVDTLKSE